MEKNKKIYTRMTVAGMCALFLCVYAAQEVLAKQNPPGPAGGGPGKGGNPPGIAGGAGHGNPAGPAGGPGRGNPPGPMGGAGSGPAWRDNPNKIDNPPGAVGVRGTDWKNPAGPVGGPGQGNIPGPMGGPGAGPRWKDNPNTNHIKPEST